MKETTVGLVLRPDAYYAQAPDGAYILTHEGASTLTGRTVYQVIERLAPFLDGRFSCTELTAHLPVEHRQMVDRLITALLERGVVREAEQPHRSAADSGPEVAFAGYFTGAPDSAVRTYQDTAVTVLGTGRLGAAVAAAVARSGVRRVRVADIAEDGDLPQFEAAVWPLLDDADLVLHAADRPMMQRACLLDRLCADAGVLLAQAMIMGDHAWIAGMDPGGDPGDEPGFGWTSGWRRLRARQPHAAASSVADDLPSAPAPDAVAVTAVASQLVHLVFRSISGAAAPAKRELTRVDLSSLGSVMCSLVPHPFAAPAEPGAETQDRIAGLRAGTRLDEDELARRAVILAGDRLGVIGVPDEREFAQLPLRVCEIEVSDPVGLLDPGAPVAKVTGAGPDFAAARHRAVLSAFARYASLMIDPRRLHSIDGRPVDPRTDPYELLSALRSGELSGAVRGYGVLDGATCLVDVAAAFPALRRATTPYLRPHGVAAAYGWDDAVVAGLLDHCRRLTMAELTAAATPFPQVDLAGAALDPRGDRYRALLAAIGEPVTVYDVTGSLGVPTVVGYLGPVPAGCASADSLAGALTEALEQVLLQYQAILNDQPAYAPPRVADIPAHLRGSTAHPLRDEAPRSTGDLAAALLARGYRAIVVPLDHDSEVHATMPYIVHVVIRDEFRDE